MSQSLLVSLGNATVSYLICILHNYFLIAPTAVQECRDRALLNQSDFTGLAGVGCEEGFEVHSLDDSREEEGHVKLSNPRPDAAIPTPSRPAEPASISSSKSKPSPKFKVPPHVKFGPPRASQGRQEVCYTSLKCHRRRRCPQHSSRTNAWQLSSAVIWHQPMRISRPNAADFQAVYPGRGRHLVGGLR